MKYKLSKQRKEPIPRYREIKVGGEKNGRHYHIDTYDYSRSFQNYRGGTNL